MANTDVLLQLLEAYDGQLQQHVAQLSQEYHELEVRWHALRNVYEGNAAEQFKAAWEQTSLGFQEYIELAQPIMKILEERIEALRRAGRIEKDLLS